MEILSKQNDDPEFVELVKRAGFAKEEQWRVLQTKGIAMDQVQSLIENQSEAPQ